MAGLLKGMLEVSMETDESQELVMAVRCTPMAILHAGLSQPVSSAPSVIEDLQAMARLLRDFLPPFEGKSLDGREA